MKSTQVNKQGSRSAATASVARLAVQIVSMEIVFSAALFVPAGTLHWPWAWSFLAIMFGSTTALSAWLMRFDPDLLLESAVRSCSSRWSRIAQFSRNVSCARSSAPPRNTCCVDSLQRRDAMRESERNVGRADHNPAGANAAAEGAQDPEKVTGDEQITANDSADAKAHGTHGRGRGTERKDTPPPPQPDRATGSDRGGSAGWGSEGSGGSVID